MAGYGTDEGFEAWVEANGFDLSATSSSSAVLRQRGSAYIDAVYGARFRGSPAGGLAQERAWPRSGAFYGVAEIGDDVMPDAVVRASYVAAYQEALSPGSLLIAATQAGSVKKEKIASLEVEYFQGTGDALGDGTVRLTEIEGLLAPFMVAVDYREPTFYVV